MSVWFLVIVLVAADGSSAKALLNTSQVPKYNTAEACTNFGKKAADELQQAAGDKIKVFWECQAVKESDFKRALPPSI